MSASVHAWRALVALDRLSTWMTSVGLGNGPVEAVTPLVGGTQNVMLRFRFGAGEFVLRRPPSNPYRDGNDTMRREAKVLGALADTDVPHPRLVAYCENPDIIGAAFYLMEPVDGFNARVALPPLHAGDPAVRHAMGLALADGIAALGAIDPDVVGLGDLGRVEGFLERQVERWRRQLDSYCEFSGWPGPQSLPHVDPVAAWLTLNRPASFTPGILHGDYHFANVLFRPDGPQLAAIVDWELATLGDPLVDLGWLIATWPDPDGGGPIFDIRPWHGFPTAFELVEHYARASSRDLSAIKWYAVLGCYKLAILQEGTHARAFAGKADRETGRALHGRATALFERAARWIHNDAPL